jgi:hypothetical protein
MVEYVASLPQKVCCRCMFFSSLFFFMSLFFISLNDIVKSLEVEDACALDRR